jgi:hypothetical protein
MKIEIKNRWNGNLIVAGEYADLRTALEQSARQQVHLSGADLSEVATATENPTIPVRIRQNHLTNSPNGAMNGDA